MTLRIVAGDKSRPEALDNVRAAHGLPVGDIALYQRLQQQLGTIIEHAFILGMMLVM